jgi:hypothetical protein
MFRLRFSLRELLLGMLVCAALAAWVHERRDRNLPLRQSHIAEYFATQLQNDIRAARASTGETGDGCLFFPDSCLKLTGVWKAEHCLNREWFCLLRLPWGKAPQFHDELIRRINTHIRHGQVGEHVSTSEYESEIKMHMTDFFGDCAKYHCGNIHGTLHVYLARMDDQNARLVAISSEHRVP